MLYNLYGLGRILLVIPTVNNKPFLGSQPKLPSFPERHSEGEVFLTLVRGGEGSIMLTAVIPLLVIKSKYFTLAYKNMSSFCPIPILLTYFF